jgi:hypothetical protein
MYSMCAGVSKHKARKAKTRRLLKRFQEAVIACAFKGTGDPMDYKAIEAEYQAARKALLAHVDEV